MGRPPKYKCKEDYFDIIETDSQAYILGFIWADGSLSKRTGLSIVIGRKDIEIIEFIKNQMQTNVPFRFIKDGKYVGLHINRIKIYQSLVKLGLGKNRSQNNVPIPNIKLDLMPHFLRGFFDGDGSIWKAEGYRVGFTKGYNFLSWIKERLLEYGITSGNIRMRRKNNPNGCSMDITGRKNIEKLYSLLYTDSKFALYRKEKLFIAAKEYYKKLDEENWRLNGVGSSIKELLDSGLYSTEISRILHMNFNSVRRIADIVRKEGYERNITKAS